MNIKDDFNIKLISKEDKEKIEKSMKVLASYMEEDEKEFATYSELEHVYESINSLYSSIYQMEDNIYAMVSKIFNNYTILPKLTPSQLAKLLDSAGASEDFEVAKKYCTASKQTGNKLEVSITKK